MEIKLIKSTIKFILLKLVFSMIVAKVFAQGLVVDITEGRVAPLPIAIQKFVNKS